MLESHLAGGPVKESLSKEIIFQPSIEEQARVIQKKNGENSPRQSLQSSFNPCFSTLLFYDTHTHTTSA